jgi:hypothetical protein
MFNKLKNLGVPQKLYGLFGLVTCLLLLTSFEVWLSRNKTESGIHNLVENINGLSVVSQASANISIMNLAAMDAIVDANQKFISKDVLKNYVDANNFYAKNQNVLKKYFLASGRTEANFESFMASYQVYTKTIQKLFDEITKGNLTEKKLANFDDIIDIQGTKSIELLDDIKAVIGKMSKNNQIATVVEIKNFSTISLIMISSILLLLAFLGIPLIFGVVKQLSYTALELTNSSQTLANVSGKLKNASDNLTDATTQQAASIQESVASMAEISATLSQNSENARQSSEQANIVGLKTESGTLIMEKMVGSMSAIQTANAQLQNIAQIIQEINQKTQVINDIVFKTQLLAFNASIEAARAGQHGRGFSVVADEVGNLAKMSGLAANQIQSLLEDSKRQVSSILNMTESRVTEGQNVCIEAKKSFEEIAKSVLKIAAQVNSIFDASKEQEMGVRQISESMGLIDISSRKVSSIAQENANFALGITKQCNQLEFSSSDLQKIVGIKVSEIYSSNHRSEGVKSISPDISSDDDSFKSAA